MHDEPGVRDRWGGAGFPLWPTVWSSEMFCVSKYERDAGREWRVGEGGKPNQWVRKAVGRFGGPPVRRPTGCSRTPVARPPVAPFVCDSCVIPAVG